MPAIEQEGSGGFNAPARNGVLVTPSDGSDLDYVTRGLYIGVAGTVKVDMVDSGTFTFTAPAGIVFPGQVTRVYLTGTTATSIIALW